MNGTKMPFGRGGKWPLSKKVSMNGTKMRFDEWYFPWNGDKTLFQYASLFKYGRNYRQTLGGRAMLTCGLVTKGFTE